jgi:hypothetical protein
VRNRNLAYPEDIECQRVEKGDGSMGKEQKDRESDVISTFGTFSADLVLVRFLTLILLTWRIR